MVLVTSEILIIAQHIKVSRTNEMKINTKFDIFGILVMLEIEIPACEKVIN
jgi:hypothetical protein